MRKIRVSSVQEKRPATSPRIIGHRRDSSISVANSEETLPASWVQLLASRKKDFKVVSEFAGCKIVREPVPIDMMSRSSASSSISSTASKAEREPAVSGASAKEALELALEITAQIQAGS